MGFLILEGVKALFIIFNFGLVCQLWLGTKARYSINDVRWWRSDNSG